MTGRRGWPIVLSEVTTALGELVREARLAHDPPLTYDAAAEKCGLRPWNVQDIERGKSKDPGATVLLGISRGLDIPLDRLLEAAANGNGDTSHTPPESESPCRPAHGPRPKDRSGSTS